MQITVPILKEMASWGPNDPDISRLYFLAKELAEHLDAGTEEKDEADFAADRILEKLDSALAHYQNVTAPEFGTLSTSRQQAEYEGLYGALWSVYKDRTQKYLKKCGIDVGFIFQDDTKFNKKATAFISQNPELKDFVDFARKQRSGWQNDLAKNRNAHEHDGDLRGGDIPDYDNINDARRLFAQVCWTTETMLGTLVSYRLERQWNVIDTAPTSTVFDRKPRYVVEHAINTAMRDTNQQPSQKS